MAVRIVVFKFVRIGMYVENISLLYVVPQLEYTSKSYNVGIV